MSLPLVLSPATAYATKDNIVYPGSEEQARALEVDAEVRIDDVVDQPGLLERNRKRNPGSLVPEGSIVPDAADDDWHKRHRAREHGEDDDPGRDVDQDAHKAEYGDTRHDEAEPHRPHDER